MKVKIYHNPITCKTLMDAEAEVLDVNKVNNTPKTPVEVAIFNRYKEHGILSGLVKFSDGTIDDNVWFKESDIY